MMRARVWVVAFLCLSIAVPAFATGNKIYKTKYDISCAQVWSGVKIALGNPDNYKDVERDDEKLTAEYNVKHSIHWSVTGAVNQGKNRVSLEPVGTGCEMSVMSMFSGFSHNDQGDFKKRVDEGLAKLKREKPPEKSTPTAE